MSTPSQAAVYQVISDVLDVPVNQITEDTSPQSVAGWDSVQHLNLVLALEQSLGVQINPEDIEKMQSVRGILEVVRAGQK